MMDKMRLQFSVLDREGNEFRVDSIEVKSSFMLFQFPEEGLDFFLG